MFEFLYLGSIFFALLSIYLLLFSKNALRSFSNYIFSLILLLEVFFIITYLLIYSGGINQVPQLFKAPAPFNFLIPPLAYLYVRSMLLNENKISFTGLLHFIPFFLVFINYIPFYSLPVSQKVEIVHRVSENIYYALKYKSGIISESYLFYIKILQSLIYLVLQWRLIFQFKKSNPNQKIQLQLSLVIHWVKVFTWVFTGIFIGYLFLGFLFSLDPNANIFTLSAVAQGFLLSASFFVLSIYILVNPRILIGLPFVNYKVYESVLTSEKESRPFIRDNYESEITEIEAFMRSSKAYLNPNLTLALVSVETKISTKELSYIINSYYNMRFTDLVNNYRVEYFAQMLYEENLQSYTIDALIKSSGFASKSSFHAAFKKKYNCTPSQFIASQKANFSN
jgi:AraC-like DNA-binding protein